MSDHCEHVLSRLQLNVTVWGQDKGPNMLNNQYINLYKRNKLPFLQLHHITSQ